KLISYAIQENVIADVFDDKEMLTAKIMDCFVARPSTIQHYFDGKYEASPQAATEYFYELSKNSNYIQMNRIAKNVHFQADTDYGSYICRSTFRHSGHVTDSKRHGITE